MLGLFFYKKSHESDEARPSRVITWDGEVEVSQQDVIFWDSHVKKGCGIAAISANPTIKQILEPINVFDNPLIEPYESSDFLIGYDYFDDYAQELVVESIKRLQHPCKLSILIQALRINLSYYEPSYKLRSTLAYELGYSTGWGPSRGYLTGGDITHHVQLPFGFIWASSMEKTANSRIIWEKDLAGAYVPEEHKVKKNGSFYAHMIPTSQTGDYCVNSDNTLDFYTEERLREIIMDELCEEIDTNNLF